VPREVQSYPGEYELGSGILDPLTSPGLLISTILNARDIYSTGLVDFATVGPGSQVWILGYSVHVVDVPPPDPLGLVVRAEGSFDLGPPFSFRLEQELVLPVLDQSGQGSRFSGRARMESPTVRLSLSNQTGAQLTVSFQFWGKAV
jgi:hypothetical protein